MKSTAVNINYDKVAECLKYKAMAVKCAMSIYHPAYLKYIETWNELTPDDISVLCAISPINNSSILD
jgi:hypothetical protein